MDQMPTSTIVKMFEYNRWANIELIKECSRLNDEQLATEMTGAYGGIKATLVHIIRAEGGYLSRIAGLSPWADDLDWDGMSVNDLLDKAEMAGEQLVSFAAEADPSISHVIDRQGREYRFYNWTVLLQALYHGIEHRTQIKMLLSQMGVPHPELSAWQYME